MKYLSLFTALAACALGARPVAAADDVFDSNGVKIRYVTEGKGVPIVFIHGWMGDSTTWGRDKAGNTKLNTTDAAGFQLIALDCRGHGKSDKPHEPEKYGAEMAADVVRLLDHLKLEKAHLIGYSMGAFIAGKVAAESRLARTAAHEALQEAAGRNDPVPTLADQEMVEPGSRYIDFLVPGLVGVIAVRRPEGRNRLRVALVERGEEAICVLRYGLLVLVGSFDVRGRRLPSREAQQGYGGEGAAQHRAHVTVLSTTR